jgi:superfamily II DNA or RNA helicase
VTADDLVEVREPVRWTLTLGTRTSAELLRAVLCRALRGPAAEQLTPPGFLWVHQIDAFRRIVGALELFGGAFLCDAAGLGKTYVALAVAQRYRKVIVVAPSPVTSLWRRAAQKIGSRITTISHDALSRGMHLPPADLVIVDEAHRMRNPDTRRYDALAQSVRSAHLLLVTATPIVNTPLDLLHLARLFLPDHGLSVVGLASLENALTDRRAIDVLRPLSTILVSRSPTATSAAIVLPKTIDSPVVATAPLPNARLAAVLHHVDGLEFPAFENRHAADLLRLHMLHRLSSSTRAFLQTLERHRTYLRRAQISARRGEPLNRASARRLFGPDESPQLGFDLFAVAATPRQQDLRRFEKELQRLESLRAMVQHPPYRNTKLETLLRILQPRRGLKTIVFATAVATAFEIAERLHWKAVAIVTGNGARIASGSLQIHDAVAMFAPLSNGHDPPHPREAIDVLIATDVLSEGINLQDANMVVHYDLPWTPLRLQQRIGRIARLGSPFEDVHVRWLVPSPPLEHRLAIGRRIAAKVAHQQRFGVPISSRVGSATVVDRTLERREKLSDLATCRANRPPRYAVVQEDHIAAFAVEWTVPDGTVPELVVFRGDPPVHVDDLDTACRILGRVLAAPPSDSDPEWMPQEALVTLVRARWATTLHGPRNIETKRLTRLIVTRAKCMTTERRFHEIDALDSVLDRISAGIPVGGERTLRGLLTSSDRALDQGQWLVWSKRWRRPQMEVCGVRLEAAIIGDGTRS